MASNPLVFSAAEDNPYTPTYQFPASTPSPKSEGNYRESCALLLTGTVTSRHGVLLVAEEIFLFICFPLTFCVAVSPHGILIPAPVGFAYLKG